MNPKAQTTRRDAAQQIRADLEASLEDFQCQIDFIIGLARKERAQDLADVRAYLDQQYAIMLAQAVQKAAEFSEPIRRGFFGRLWWLVSGRAAPRPVSVRPVVSDDGDRH